MGTIKEDEGLRLLRNVEILRVLNGEDIGKPNINTNMLERDRQGLNDRDTLSNPQKKSIFLDKFRFLPKLNELHYKKNVQRTVEETPPPSPAPSLQHRAENFSALNRRRMRKRRTILYAKIKGLENKISNREKYEIIHIQVYTGR
ncbi:unnamed protein product [Acanthoscelides obtectus]|uniref:Uncharacterized protein n=1 Tax=Acanthoscelides obtectus TaxID=200917 RepID=A0A9P0KB74_ACAOB|nr:unnamed protein product [Acanthoscelides obtectus]CAK1628457.1 hypothetical protein AOBTE_LOCUS5227 [Acanthoscelides obtectus]